LENYLDQKKKNSVNTRRKEISRVRRLVRMAIRKGDVPISKDPFLIYQLPKGQKVERRKLSLEEIKKLEEVSLDSFASLARDAFLLSFYGAGIRFGDLCLLKSNNVKDGRLLYRAAKTKKLISIPLPLQATKILQRYSVHDMSEDYIIPLMAGLDVSTETNLKARISSRNAQVNTYLKRIAKKAGLDSEGLSMHVARHSYADYARRSSGNIHAIMQALGHSDIRVTQTYLKSFDSDAVDEMTRTMWE
jgi:integrase